MPKLPAKDPRDIGPGAKPSQKSVNLPAWQWKRIDEICEAQGYSMTEFFREIVRSFVDEYDATALDTKKASSK